MINGLRIGRVHGIDIRVNWSVVVIGWLLAWSLATAVLPELVADRSDTAYWVAAGIATLGFLAALVAHELGHSLIALRNDVEVQSITLWLFGGVAVLGTTPESPRAALHIAVAGPLVSLGLGALGVGAGLALEGLVGASVTWFGVMNLFLGVFNLLPAYPLDGGRVYQAWLWRRGVPADRATAKAAGLGGAIGLVMIWIGVVEVLLANIIGGVWMMGLGWFLREASRSEADQARRGEPMRRLHVRDLMTSTPETVHPDLTAAQFVDDVVWPGRHAAYPVVAPCGDVLGLLTLRKIGALEPQRYRSTRVGDLMLPVDELAVVHPDDTVEALAQAIGIRTDHRALVLDGGRLVGIVSPSDLARLITVIDLREPLRSSESV